MTSFDKKSHSHAPLQLCIFDDRRGEKEGQEADKILGFYPSNTPPDSQAALVGLTQAALAFTSTFQPDSPCSALSTEHKRWILHPCEPHIYILMVVEREWHRGFVRESGLKTLLIQLHQLLTLIHGLIGCLLQKDASGGAAREAVQEVLREIGARLDKQRGLEFSRLHNPLSAFDAVPLLHLPHQLHLSKLLLLIICSAGERLLAELLCPSKGSSLTRSLSALATGMQSLVNRVLISPIWDRAPVVGLMLMHESWMLSTTLCLADTNALYHFYTWAILPAIKAASQSSFGRKITRSNSVPQPGRRRSILQRSAWELSSGGFLTLSQPFPEKAVDAEESLRLPCLWLQSRQEWVLLLILQVMDEIMMVLLPENSAISSSTAEGLALMASTSMKIESNQVSRYLQSIRRDHIPSFRYLFTDNGLMTTKASPGSKVATLSRNSLSLTNAARADFEARERENEEGSSELAIWGHHDCWVIAKSQGEKKLYTVLEQHNKEGLTDACKAVDKFAHLHFECLFD